MGRKKYSVRLFQCNECGEKREATKVSSRMTSEGHQKHIYCIKCRKVTQHTQLSNY